MAKVSLINPPLIDIKTNFAGIASIPLGISYLAAYLRKGGVDVGIIDGFGEAWDVVQPFKGKYFRVGLSPQQIADRIPHDVDLVGVSVISSIFHNIALEIIEKIKEKDPSIPIVVGGNHATFTYADFLENGADFVVLGEGEKALFELTEALQNGEKLLEIDGLAYKEAGKIKINPKIEFIKDVDSLPFPARDLLPLENYWKLHSAHGPVNYKYTSIMSSRGCPFACAYCSSPSFWQRKWRARSPNNVVDEIEHCIEKYGIKEFQFEDDNMTLHKKRLIKICEEIVERGLDIVWSTPNGIRADFVDKESLEWMKRAGCYHITLAPETGSDRVLGLMNKRISLTHLRNVAKLCDAMGITTCAFFILGFPGENKEDRKKTKGYIVELARSGLDELSIGMVIPLPGSEIYKLYKFGVDFDDWEDLMITVPYWRTDYRELHRERVKMFISFYLTQLLFHPKKVLRHIPNVLTQKQETKTDMALIRLFKYFKEGHW